MRLGLIALALPWLACSGCYYGHLAVGQTRLWLAERPARELLDDPGTPDALRTRLELTREVRAFASEIGLDVGEQYTGYVAWPGDRIVTTVVATRPGEIEAAGFRFPIVGKVPYKGFFDQSRAEAEAEDLRGQGLDVCVVPVRAYSTLGWFDDPLTAPMLQGDLPELVETLLHELVHATVFLESDPDFNEGIASFVGEEAAVLFVNEKGLPGDERAHSRIAAVQRQRVLDGRLIDRELLGLRNRVGALYAEEEDAALRDEQRQLLVGDARERMAALPLRTLDAATLATKARLGDACLALRGTYAAATENLASALDARAGDLRVFIADLRAAAKEEDPRAALLGPAVD